MKTHTLFIFLFFVVFQLLPLHTVAKTNVTKTTDDGIDFFVGTWEQTLEMANLINNPIFVYIYTNYTPACRRMEQEVYTNSRVEQQYKEKFINFKLNLHSQLGVDFKMRYELSEYPSLLYFDKHGELLFKTSGEKTVRDMLDLAKKALTNRPPIAQTGGSIPTIYANYLDHQAQYENGLRDADFLYRYAEQLKKFNEPTNHVVIQYIEKAVNPNPTQAKNVNFIYDFADNIHGAAFEFLLKNKHYYLNLIGRDKLHNRIKQAIRSAVISAAANKSPDLFEHALDLITQANLPDAKEFNFLMVSVYAENIQDWDRYAQTALSFLGKNMVKDAKILNGIAWKFAANISDKSKLTEASKWAQRAITLAPQKYKYIETYAALLYKLGKKSKAMKEAERAVELARLKSENYKSTLQLIEIIRGNQPLPKQLKKS